MLKNERKTEERGEGGGGLKKCFKLNDGYTFVRAQAGKGSRLKCVTHCMPLFCLKALCLGRFCAMNRNNRSRTIGYKAGSKSQSPKSIFCESRLSTFKHPTQL